MHGIVYVPESEAPSDPLEAEGVSYIFTFVFMGCYPWGNGTSMEEAGWGIDLALKNRLLTSV